MGSRKSVFGFWVLIVATTLVISGCVSIQSYQQNDPYKITHHTWWNYYQRGRLYLHDGNYIAARNDFETALGRLPGARSPYAKDRWRVRTYGMHMLDGYFPHRELGICLFHMNKSTEALQLLETSMQMEPSARAKFYINRIHEQLAKAAAPPPRIKTSTIPAWTNQRSITVQGTASGSNEIVRIELNDVSEFIELAKQRLEFQQELSLIEGTNLIQIVAEDVSGKQTTTNLVLIADWTPPQIGLRRKGAEVIIDCVDNLQLNEIQVNERSISSSGGIFSLSIPIEDKSLSMTIKDKAGNSTAWSLSKRELSHMAQSTETTPPLLRIDNAGQILVQNNPEYGLDIQAEDDTALKTIELNGNEILTRTTPLFRTLRRIPLVLGTNQLTVAVEDFDGNRTEQKVSVVYRPPEYLDQTYRLTAMLVPVSGEIPNADFARRIYNLLGKDLTLDPIRFYLLATKEETSQMRNEQSLSSSELADHRAMLKKGNELDTDLIFITKILSDAPGQTVYTQVLDARSEEELFIEDIYMEEPDQLPEQLDGLVMKIEQRFPLLKGAVQQFENKLTINEGKENGAHKGMRLLVIRSDDAFEQGHVLQDNNQPIELVISEVESKSSRVIMANGHPKDSVRSGDYVYSR